MLEELLPQLVGRQEFPRETLLNVNLPPISPQEVKGVCITRLARRVYVDSLTRATDPKGRPYFWIGGGGVEWTAPEGTDFHAVSRGYISVTPLHLDITNHALLADVERWNLHL
jgi:5'-nucleotidase